MEKIDDPFPSYLHLGLKLHPRVGVIVRDIQDIRGNYKPDIGSIIGYALSAIDYEVGHFGERRTEDSGREEEGPFRGRSPAEFELGLDPDG